MGPGQKKKPKRRPGGQPGNTNARKHGFFSASALSPREITAFLDIMKNENIDPRVACFRVRLKTLLDTAPGSSRARNALSRQLAEYYRIKFRMDEAESKELVKMIKRILEEGSRSGAPGTGPEIGENDKTNQAYFNG